MIEITVNNYEWLRGRRIRKIESDMLRAEVGKDKVTNIQFYDIQADKVLFFVTQNNVSTTYGATRWEVTPVV